MKIVKHSGNIVDYDATKLKKSLLNSGADEVIVKKILEEIEKEIYDGITTKHIYKHAFELLKKASKYHAARYNLKEAIHLLGPAGFFFEKYIARIFAAENYETKSNLTLKGSCVSHEIDVLVRKNDQVSMVECKFHMSKDVATDVKVPMYILSRFNDLNVNRYSIFTSKDIISNCWIVTNNRFTSDAVEFANCSGLKLLSWDYPEGDNIKTKNDKRHLYPVTCLTTLTISEKEKLLILDLILVSEIASQVEKLAQIGLSPLRIKHVLREVSDLCQGI
ncbi:MAG: restriction endonuclease [Flavobacterium sp.]